MSQDDILNYLKNHKHASAKEMSEALGIGITSIRKGIRKLRDLDHIEVVFKRPSTYGSFVRYYTLKEKSD